MKEIDIFEPKYLIFFCYDNDSVEFLYNFLQELGYDFNKPISNIVKKEVLNIIKELMKLDVIYVFHWGKDNIQMRNKTLSIQETLNYINKSWYENTKYPDYYDMVMFGYKKWYIEKLKDVGYIPNKTNWSEFVKENIGDLEKWIEENKPEDARKDE